MKTILQTVALAALFIGAQAKAEDAPIVLSPQWTYADRAAPGGSADAFPGSASEMIVLESSPAHAAGIAQGSVVRAFPGSSREDPIVVESISTYADQFVTGRNVQASAASDPALSR